MMISQRVFFLRTKWWRLGGQEHNVCMNTRKVYMIGRNRIFIYKIKN